MTRNFAVFVALVTVVPAFAGPMDFDQPSGQQSGGRRGKDEFVILGVEQLPDFTVLIDRENLSKNYDLELKEKFLPKIYEALDKAPF